ncbi:hypothetical protein ACFQ1S_41880, partial [Kibdelosporangium lantanae]
MTAYSAADTQAPEEPQVRPRVDSEVGTLRTVLLHRPGAELKRLTPRNNDNLLFDGIPWVDRAQEEHEKHFLATVGSGNWYFSDDDEFRFDPVTGVLRSFRLHVP